MRLDKKELKQLSKGQLIEIILLYEERLTELERLLKSFDNAHTPSSKKHKKNTQGMKENTPRFPGKPKGSNGGGITLPKPDRVVERTLNVCPDCSTKLDEPVNVYRKRVIDLPEKLAITTEYCTSSYFCPTCKKNVCSDVHVPRTIYGPRVQSMITVLKNSTLSHEKIAQFLRDCGFPTLSAPSALSMIHRFVGKLKEKRDLCLTQLRHAPYLHADETGMRKDGSNGFVWGIFTQNIAFLSAELSRARKHIQRLLPGYRGVVVCDGYNAYDEFPLKQRCWAHLLREAKEHAKKHDEIAVQYTRLKILYERLKEMNEGPPDDDRIRKAKWQLQDIVTCLNAITSGRQLATLIENGGDDWFTALYHPGVPLTNNHAERGLRHIVLHRKMMGCYRNEKGKNWIDIGISVLQSWRLQGKNPYQELCNLAMQT